MDARAEGTVREPPPLDPDLLDRLAGRVLSAGGPREARDAVVPFTGETLGRVPLARPPDVREAVRRARPAQEAWARRTPRERASVLRRFHDRVLDRREELLDLVQLESGKARIHAFEEVADTALVARHYGFHAPALLRPDRRRGAFPLLTRADVHRHPVGVVGIIAPWNYPLSLAATDALPALAAGNAVVLLPDLRASFTALRVAELLEEVGLPSGLFRVVTGEGPVLGPVLVDTVDYVSFTGSTETGREVARRAAGRLVGCSLELGGKNPMVVFADADLERALDGAVRGAFASAGQLCISLERLYVEASIFEEFVEGLAGRARDLRLGAELGYGPEMGSLISGTHLAKVSRHVEEAVEAGARLRAGGRPRPDIGPWFYEPTVLTGVLPETAVHAEETFGPVASVYPFDGPEEALERANATRYGLAASVWTGDADFGRRFATRIRAGTVNVNEAYAAAWASVDAPMGGRGDSGLGRRHGREGLLKYTEAQTVATQRALPLAPPRTVPPGRWAEAMVRLLRVLRRIPGLR